MAARLSEVPNFKVLLLEAGPDDRNSPELEIPGASMALWKDEFFWYDKTVPQKNACFGNRNNVSDSCFPITIISRPYFFL